MRKLDDIIPPSRRRESEPMRERPSHDDGAPESRFSFISILIGLAVILVAVGALFYFSTTKIIVTPRNLSAEIEGSFSAARGEGVLSFEVITAEKIASEEAKSTGTKNVNSFASGSITVYNTQSKAQPLIANTRFATASGLVFRIRSGITVPAGSTSKPGSVTATVYADKVGDAYNIEGTSFTLPGLAGTSQATQVYARSTGPMTGGASGTVPIIDESTEKAIRARLSDALEKDLLTSIEAQVPTGYVLVPGATSITYRPLASTPKEGSLVDVREQGTISAVVFPNVALAKTLAGTIAGFEYQNEPLSLTDVSALLLSPSKGLPGSGEDTFSFSLGGTVEMEYTVDPTRIAAAISGKTRSEAKMILNNYPEVHEAVIMLRPFWRKALPEDPSTIEVSIDTP